MTRLSRRGVLTSSAGFLVGSALGTVQQAQASADVPVRLNHNENRFGPSAKARDALLGIQDQAWKYAYDEATVLVNLIADREGVGPENVILGAGSRELLKLAAILHGAPGKEVIAARPTYSMLPDYAGRRGAIVNWVDLDGAFGHDFAAMGDKLNDQTDLVYVCNPNNPTGTVSDANKIRDFIRTVSERALVVVDEAYIEFTENPAAATVADQVRAGQNVLVTRTFSKIYGLAGLSIGYAIGRVDTVYRLSALSISVPNQAGVAAARASIADEGFLSGTRSKVNNSIRFVTGLCGELGLRYAPTQANFLMIDTAHEAFEFMKFARDHGVMVAPVQAPFSSWIRVTMGSSEDMEQFGRVLREFVKFAAGSIRETTGTDLPTAP